MVIGSVGAIWGGHMGSGNFAGWYVVVYGVSGAVMGNLYEIDVGGGLAGLEGTGRSWHM